MATISAPRSNILASLLCLSILSACGGSKPLNSTEVAARNIYSANLSIDSQLALIGTEYHGGSLWRLRDNERLFDWNHRSGEQTLLTAASFSPDGLWALTTDSKTLVLWNTETGTGERFWSSPADVLALSLGAKGNLALLGLADRTAALYATKRGGILRSFQHAERVTSVALSEDGKLALTGSDDHSAIIWDTESGESLHSKVHADPIQLVALSRDGQRALSAAQYDSIQVWATASGETLWQMPLKQEWLRRGMTITSARFSDDGSHLLSGRPDGVVQLWNIDQQSLIYEWRLPRRKLYQPLVPAVLSVGFGVEGNRFYAVSSDGFVHQLGY
jgi:WD40 repeat protein